MPIELLLQRPAYMSKRHVSLEEVHAWAAEHGYHIPDDYARFITRYNGGTVKPYVFPQTHPDFQAHGGLMIVEELYDWDAALATSDFTTPQPERHLPPGYLAIGADLGEAAYIIMCISAGLIGQILVVEKRRYGIWGFEGHDVVGHVADSFTAFLELLQDPKSEGFYHDYWVYGDPDVAKAIRVIF